MNCCLNSLLKFHRKWGRRSSQDGQEARMASEPILLGFHARNADSLTPGTKKASALPRPQAFENSKSPPHTIRTFSRGNQYQHPSTLFNSGLKRQILVGFNTGHKGRDAPRTLGRGYRCAYYIVIHCVYMYMYMYMYMYNIYI